MNDIKLIRTSQIMIFPADDIDFYSLNNEESIQVIVTNFQLNRVPLPAQFPAQMNQVMFQNGSFQYKKEKFIIEQLLIEDRKIVINILSDSDVSNAFFSELKSVLRSLDLRKAKGKYEPLVCTYETTCILKLNFKFEQLCTSLPLSKIEEAMLSKIDYSSNISIIPSAIRFQISYDKIPNKLLKNKITIADKHFIIELREKTDPEDQIYFTVSPTDTETHFALLKIFEESLS